MSEIEELDYIDYLMFRRDAFINALNKTEKGLEYLNNAYRLEIVEPDRQGLRDTFGKGGAVNGE